ncbi:MAG: hypothetical protein Q8L49_14175 [Burkholderiaceae bacterium]|nr:hypothetical protein [Burkholderiaceae bacterium]
MKLRNLLATATLSCGVASGVALAASDHSHGVEAKPLHGGIVAVASDLEFELLAKADAITLYVRDHGKPALTQGASAKLTILSGTDKTEAALAPVGDNKLEAKGSYKLGAGTKFVATVSLQGKNPVNVRFVAK